MNMTETGRITRFGLVRHAETIWNREHRIQGQEDSPLTDEGKKNAKKWGRLLKRYPFNRILSSDTGRAQQTANLINTRFKLPLSTDCRLREQDWGLWTTKTFARIENETPQMMADQIAAGWGFCPPGGEDRRQVLERSRLALRAAAELWPGQTVLVVTHEGVIKCLLYHFYQRKFLPSEPALIISYQLHWLVHDRHGLRVEALNAMTLS